LLIESSALPRSPKTVANAVPTYNHPRFLPLSATICQKNLTKCQKPPHTSDANATAQPPKFLPQAKKLRHRSKNHCGRFQKPLRSFSKTTAVVFKNDCSRFEFGWGRMDQKPSAGFGSLAESS